MPFYAQINDADVVVAVTQTAEPVASPEMIEVDSLRVDLLGQVYSGGQFAQPG